MLRFPGFVPAYIRPLFCEGRGHSGGRTFGRTFGHPSHRQARCLNFFRTRNSLPLDSAAQKPCAFRACLRASAGSGMASATNSPAINDLVARGELKAPIVIGRDHLDCGSVASPYRETESMRDGSDAIADWPFLNALLNYRSGASWVSIHNGGGVALAMRSTRPSGRCGRYEPKWPRVLSASSLTIPASASRATPTRATPMRFFRGEIRHEDSHAVRPDHDRR